MTLDTIALVSLKFISHCSDSLSNVYDEALSFISQETGIKNQVLGYPRGKC
jgi:hypothetical protein